MVGKSVNSSPQLPHFHLDQVELKDGQKTKEQMRTPPVNLCRLIDLDLWFKLEVVDSRSLQVRMKSW